jgi:hypothetical protein
LVGRIWLRVDTTKKWTCFDNAVGAAVWVREDTILTDGEAIGIGTVSDSDLNNLIYTNETDKAEVVTEIHLTMPTSGVTGLSSGSLELGVATENSVSGYDVLDGVMPGVLEDHQVVVYRPESTSRLAPGENLLLSVIAPDSGLTGEFCWVVVYTKTVGA